MLKKLHHVAYRCADAQKTVEFYTKYLDLKFSHALSNDRVPSTQEWSPHLHIFFEMEDQSCIAFFEVPCSPAAQKDVNTPDWVQHLALEVKDEATLQKAKKKLQDGGIQVVGVTDHGFCESIYFFDPSGHRLELTVRTDDDLDADETAKEATELLQRWQERKNKGEFAVRGG